MLCDSVCEFVGFFGDGSSESFECLLSVPRAAVRGSESVDDVNYFVKVM